MTPVPIFVLMGTAGCGKTSVAEQIQLYLGCKYLEGDSLHPPQNVQKMTSGQPLNDDDRWPWLRSIRDHIIAQAQELQPLDNDSKKRVVVVTCSSLRKVYRDILRQVPEELGTVIFVYLKGSYELLLQRIQNRKGHFMPAKMLQSQIDTLEEPDEKIEKVIVASIVPPPIEEAKHIIDAAVEKGYLPATVQQ
ncbi:shikimate kinase [Rhizopus microsporus var. microsporus]|uniref:Gluconokinase n=2 Tax=Rhizopus microsporus TaxID=58291 RepID=A0A2G4SND1_RHIZD|nr:thermosensitive gluconokinase [Rhizopus microsporus ATCC 52813]ORE10604.1 shikimate kinase [Rhizopus microsporus var. microsporus]PHZ10273.1 thermosensitive gluconokinase [Rhizopus microsporus ATCC 52813]